MCKVCVRPLRRTRGNMVPVLRPIWAFFLLHVRKSRILQDTPGGNLRDKEAVRRRASPPLGPYLQRGRQSGPRLRAPPLRRWALRRPLAGRHKARLDIGRPGMAAPRTAAALSIGGGGAAACSTTIRRRASLDGGKRWGRAAPGDRGRRPFTVRQCAHWHRFLCRLPRHRWAVPARIPPPRPPKGGKGQSSYSACLPL